MGVAFFAGPEIPVNTARALRELSAAGRLPQSVMLTGGDARLREKCGLELAAAELCLSPENGLPCGKCGSCIKVKAGTHPDLIKIVPSRDKKTVSLDTVRELVLEKLYIAPNESDNKVYLFPEAQELSAVIQNALLKSVEEPPVFVSFIFLCTGRDAVLETVASRCAQFSLGTPAELTAKKEEEKAAAAAVEIADALCKGDAFDIMLSTAPMIKNRELMKKTAEKLSVILRDAMAVDSGMDLLSGAVEQATGLSLRFSIKELINIKDSMDKIIEYAEHNANENLLISEFSAMLIKEALWQK